MVELDVMVHNAVTAVRYESVSLAGIGKTRRSASNLGIPLRNEDATAPVRAQTIDQRDDEESEEGEGSTRGVGTTDPPAGIVEGRCAGGYPRHGLAWTLAGNC